MPMPLLFAAMAEKDMHKFWGGLCYDGFVKNMHDNNANIIGMV